VQVKLGRLKIEFLSKSDPEQEHNQQPKPSLKRRVLQKSLYALVLLSLFSVYSNLRTNIIVNRQSAIFYELISEYRKAVEDFVSEIQALDLPDDFTTLMEIQRRIWEQGIGHDGTGFTFSLETQDILGHLGIDVMNRQGSCRHIVAFFQDVLDELGMDSSFIPTFAPGTPDGHQFADIERTSSIEGDIDDSQLIRFLQSIVGNHAVLRVNNVSVYCAETEEFIIVDRLYLDPTNPSVLLNVRGQRGLVSLNQTDPQNEDWVQTRKRVVRNDVAHLNGPIPIAFLNIADFFQGVTQEEFEQLKNLLGIESQNYILDNLRELN